MPLWTPLQGSLRTAEGGISAENSTLIEYYKEGVKREFLSGDTRVTSELARYDIKK